MKRSLESLRADLWLLKKRLGEHGLNAARDVEVHENSRVMVSLTGKGVLRLHRGYAYAGDDVLKAIVVFVTPGYGKSQVSLARKTLLEFPVSRFSAGRPVRKQRPHRHRVDDLPDINRLEQLHSELNGLHFDSELGEIQLRISHRMIRKLGEITMDRRDRAVVITISRRHVDRDGWKQVAVTLLHEMVHQWQAETGRPVDHGKEFRRKAVEVGIPASAARRVSPERKTA